MNISEQTQDYIRQHAADDVRQLALQGTKDPAVDLIVALQQIAGRQTARRKLPAWAVVDGVIYPPHLNMEQCSSELTARYKAGFIGKGAAGGEGGSTLVDLTGGFGVDFYWMAQHFATRVYVEQSAELCDIAEQNFRRLGLSCSVECAKAADYLTKMGHADLVFLDPARRNENGSRTYGIADCSPNVLELLPLLEQKSNRVLLKLSPMLDWRKAVSDLRQASAVHIVSVDNECKELLVEMRNEKWEMRNENEEMRNDTGEMRNEKWEMRNVNEEMRNDTGGKRNDTGEMRNEKWEMRNVNEEMRNDAGGMRNDAGGKSLQVVCINMQKDREQRFEFTYSPDAPVTWHSSPTISHSSSPISHSSSPISHSSSLISHFLYEPNASIMKAGCFAELEQAYPVRQVAANSHLFLSADEIEDFPGRRFEILSISSMNKKNLSENLTSLKSANITVRNFPLSADQLRKKLKLKDGGDNYIFATTLPDGQHRLFTCRRC